MKQLGEFPVLHIVVVGGISENQASSTACEHLSGTASRDDQDTCRQVASPSIRAGGPNLFRHRPFAPQPGQGLFCCLQSARNCSSADGRKQIRLYDDRRSSIAVIGDCLDRFEMVPLPSADEASHLTGA
jgi:hypothetical protein